jgi:hypothetical protein
MPDLHERYLTDQNGNRVGVVLNIAQYEQMLADLEELESIRAFDAAMADRDEAVPFEQAIDEITRQRK